VEAGGTALCQWPAGVNKLSDVPAIAGMGQAALGRKYLLDHVAQQHSCWGMVRDLNMIPCCPLHGVLL
jgi:hypothetical protein